MSLSVRAAIVSVVIAILAYYFYVRVDDIPKDGWYRDRESERAFASIVCDIHIFNSISELGEGVVQSNGHSDKPFILRGFTSSWPAQTKWTFENFTRAYGKRLVKTGSESSIVYGGGIAGIPKSIDAIVKDLRLENNSDSDSFIFDVSILKSIPELKRDYVTPKVFSVWDNSAAENVEAIWHMLSLGASRNGLPFHVHGATWLGLVFGLKRWFLYPPGFGPPESSYTRFLPIRKVWDWLREEYPSLRILPQPPKFLIDLSINSSQSQSPLDLDLKGAPGYRPFECIQQPGDLLYLPSGWSHQTLNIGEAIALGGQAALSAEERLRISNGVLTHTPRNLDALKGAGLSLAHMATDLEESVKQHLRVNKDGLVLLHKKNFKNLVLDREDTWLVHFYDTKSSKFAKEFPRALSGVAARLKGLVSVGAMEIIDSPADDDHSSYHADGFNLLDSRPVIVIYPGGSYEYALKFPDDFPLTVTNISDFVLDILVDSDRNLEAGSVGSLGAKSKRLFRAASNHLRLAAEISPFHPEIRGLLGEVLGYLGDISGMESSIMDAVHSYDQANLTGASIHSIASVYHKLGSTFLTQRLSTLAIPVLQKSLFYSPRYTPAMVDLTASHIMNNDAKSAGNVLRTLTLVSPRHSAIPRLKDQLKKISIA